MTTLSKIDIQMLEKFWINHEVNMKHLQFLQQKPSLQVSENDKSRLRNLKIVIQGVHKIYQELDPDLKAIVDMRYWKNEGNRYEWMEISDELFMSRSKILRKRNLLLKKTAELIGWV